MISEHIDTLDTWRARPATHSVLRAWLCTPGSLTQRLKVHSHSFNVIRLRQAHARPFPDEVAPLSLVPGRLALVREVVLRDASTPLVYAHSVAPLHSLKGAWRALAGLGNRPLGEALFADPSVVRAPLSFRQLDARHPLYRQMARRLPTLPARLWARRSLFSREGVPLLVTEVFLPALIHA